MSNMLIFGIIVIVIFAGGLIYTFREFSLMKDKPESYQKDPDEDPEVIDKKPKDPGEKK